MEEEIHSRPYSTPNIKDPLQNAAQDSRVIPSLAYVVLANARPLVASVQQPWKTQLPMICLIAEPVAVEELGTVVDEIVPAVVDGLDELLGAI
jgi:hypothetical protein